MKRLIAALIICSATAAIAKSPSTKVDCGVHKMYCKILEIQPRANKEWAMKFSNALIRHGESYDIDPWLSLAIAMQESSLLRRNRNHKLIHFKKVCDKDGKNCKTEHEVVKGHADVGTFQLHVNTILHNDIDPVRLQNDIDYSVDWHYKILQRKLKQCRHYDKEAWACYYSRTPELHQRYVRLVSRYYHGDRQITNKTDNLVEKKNNQEPEVFKALKQKVSTMLSANTATVKAQIANQPKK